MATDTIATALGSVQDEPLTLREQLIRSVQETSATKQLEKLEAMIAAAQAARHAAARDLLFCSRSGVALLDAIHNLTEVDGVFDFAADVRREVGMDCDDWPTLPALRPIAVQPVKLNPAIWEGGETR